MRQTASKEKWEDEFDYVTMIYDIAMQNMLESINLCAVVV